MDEGDEMNDKLRAQQFYNELTWVSEGRDGDYISFREDVLQGAIERLLSLPKHETVEQWEERTGETYPDDGPVWYKPVTKYNYELIIYRKVKNWSIVYVANHNGKPPLEQEPTP